MSLRNLNAFIMGTLFNITLMGSPSVFDAHFQSSQRQRGLLWRVETLESSAGGMLMDVQLRKAIRDLKKLWCSMDEAWMLYTTFCATNCVTESQGASSRGAYEDHFPS